MSEQEVLNKYYPPDFDPSKIRKLKVPKDGQYVVQRMAPFNIRGETCGESISKGKKFDACKEMAQNEAYLDLPVFCFYIKCTCCLAEITFKTHGEWVHMQLPGQEAPGGGREACAEGARG
ncbi:hypothetical protein STEG23_030446 [Scotinomys teguina]